MLLASFAQFGQQRKPAHHTHVVCRMLDSKVFTGRKGRGSFRVNATSIDAREKMLEEC